jgi:succinylglutamic semialdehyde dehydrogenase
MVSKAEIAHIFAAARTGFSAWKKTSVAHRMSCLTEYKSILTKNRDLLAETISQEHGKPKWEALTEVDAMIGKIVITYESYHDRLKCLRSTTADMTIQSKYVPFGVFAVIGPFNFPGHLPNGHIIPLLLAGNSVVFKPSHLTPKTGKLIVEFLHIAGVPHDVVILCEGKGQHITEAEGLDGVFFTGSTKTGHTIYKTLADTPEKVVALEMGGNNATIAHKTNDLDTTIYILIQSAFISTGQRCTCTKRLILPEGDEGDRIIKRLIEVTDKLTSGSWDADPQPFMGPMIHTNAVGDIMRGQKNLVSLGGKILKEFKQIDGIVSPFVEPGIIDVTDIKDLPDEEYFGPLLQIIRTKDFAEAIEVANDTKYGLVSGIITSERELFIQASEEFKTGIVNWNRPTTGCASVVPFGGMGWSGNNRPSGYTTIEHCGHPVALHMTEVPKLPEKLLPGVTM